MLKEYGMRLGTHYMLMFLVKKGFNIRKIDSTLVLKKWSTLIFGMTNIQ